MAHYKKTEKSQGLFLSVNLWEQIIPGTYEHTLNHLIDNKLDLRIFDRKYNNDFTGAAAIEPRILLKIILYCYSLGVISSRKMAKMCETNMIVKVLAEDAVLHFKTISNFVSGISGEIEKVFSEVFLVCSSINDIPRRRYTRGGFHRFVLDLFSSSWYSKDQLNYPWGSSYPVLNKM
jgi:transposase